MTRGKARCQFIRRALALAATRGGPEATPAGDSDRRHHLACRTCGRTSIISESALQRWMSAAGREHRPASLARHFLGSCSRCGGPGRAQPPGAPPAGREPLA